VSVSQSSPSTQRGRQRLSVGVVAATALAALALPLVTTSASAVVTTAGLALSVSPVGDTVTVDGATAGGTIQVVRAGVVIGTTAALTPLAGVKPTISAGLGNVPAEGSGCWLGVTPDIRPGDVITVGADSTIVAGVTVTQRATKVNASTVTVKGTRGVLDLSSLLATITAPTRANPFASGLKLVASSVAGGGLDGVIRADPASPSNWTATFSGLTPHDVALALVSASSGTWFVPGVGVGRGAVTPEQTVFGIDETPGAAPCGTLPYANGPSMPDLITVADTGISNVDNITRNVRPTFAGTTALATATSVNLYVDDVLRGTVAVRGGRYSVQPNIQLRDGRHTIGVSETGPTGATGATGITTTMGTTRMSILVDNRAPILLRGAPRGVNISRNTSVPAVVSEGVQGVSRATFKLRKTFTGALVAGTVTYNAATRHVTLKPTGRLAPRTRYTATLTSGIRDVAGNAFVARSWVFETGR
jgi:Bacterial Ig-like domain